MPNSASAMPTPEDEVLPGRLEAGGGAVDADQQHRRQGRRFHRDPQQAHVVGRQRHQHGEAEQLVHAVIEAQPCRRHLAVVLLDAHVGPGKDRGGQADEGGQGDEKDVQRVDEERVVQGEQRPAGDDPCGERAGSEEGAEAEGHVDVAREIAVAGEREHGAADERDGEHQQQRFHRQLSLSFSRWRMSRLSNCSRIWNMKTPRIRMPTSTSRAMPSSTTIGMP